MPRPARRSLRYGTAAGNLIDDLAKHSRSHEAPGHAPALSTNRGHSTCRRKLTCTDCPIIVDSAVSSSDLFVLLKLAASDDASASVRNLAAELGISKSAVALSLKRLDDLELTKGEPPNRRVNKLAARDLLEHAARWIAPAKAGDWELGLPTAHSEPHLAARFRGDADPVVLPLPHGPLRGRAIPPLHPQAPAAAARDPRLHRLLAIVDALRIGRAREREIAASELRQCL
jgi:hypothetical protein